MVDPPVFGTGELNVRLVPPEPIYNGAMAEWFKAPVLKTGDRNGPWVRILLAPPNYRDGG